MIPIGNSRWEFEIQMCFLKNKYVFIRKTYLYFENPYYNVKRHISTFVFFKKKLITWNVCFEVFWNVCFECVFLKCVFWVGWNVSFEWSLKYVFWVAKKCVFWKKTHLSFQNTHYSNFETHIRVLNRYIMKRHISDLKTQMCLLKHKCAF